MSVVQMISIDALVKCYLILALKVSAQTYSGYANYAYNYGVRQYDDSVLPNNVMIYGSYSHPSFYIQTSQPQWTENSNQLIEQLTPFPDVYLPYFAPTQSDLQKAVLETQMQHQQQNLQIESGQVRKQSESLEQAVASQPKSMDVLVTERQSSTNISKQNWEGEDSTYIPHKPKYIDEEEDQQQKPVPLGATVFAPSQIAGTNESEQNWEGEDSTYIPHKPKYIDEEEDQQQKPVPLGATVFAPSQIAGTNESEQNWEGEDSTYIPHKPKYIDEQEDQHQKLASSGATVLAPSQIAGIVLGGIMFILLISGLVGAVYIYFIRSRSQNQAQSLIP
eukprot:TRINITY_DN114_c0_g1_i8.p2 TRINITY_DN114_c0_g1~~TRINITY_DN114_c0_g1_i8.p2  ORF type:complete len:334 (-),score=34.72 TRINITY_DN114_c0_g1_i8:257-1258(-)